MSKKMFVLISSFALILFSIELAVSQPKDKEKIVGKKEVRQLGRNLAVNLVMEPAEDKEGITIITATEHFSVEIEGEKGKKHIELQFEGKIKLTENELILISYRLKTRAVNKTEVGGFAFGLEGSVLLKEDKHVIIAKSKDMVLKLKVSSLK